VRVNGEQDGREFQVLFRLVGNVWMRAS
jgi:hypothetical protein